jgi:bacterioferritin (cytochrome b1)
LYLDGPTLERLIQGLEADSAQDAGAARAIIERVVVVDGPRPDLMDRLRRIAASTG